MSKKITVMFPGQGSQYVGMGKEFYDNFPQAREVFTRADDVLGYKLSQILFSGPEEEVNSTKVCQPGILVTSMAILAAMRASGFEGDDLGPTLGLSLGEYSALVFAEALTFEDAVRLTANRGAYMQECSDKHPSGMLSLIGADEEKAQAVCDAAAGAGVIGIANLNSPGQVVVSGANAALAKASSVAKEHGIRRAIPLKVAGAFHSELMADAAERLTKDLADVQISTPKIPVVSNVTALPTQDPEVIRTNLSLQVKNSVLFQKSIEGLLESGLGQFLEPGPSKVLCGLLSKISKETQTFSVDTPSDAEKFGAICTRSE